MSFVLPFGTATLMAGKNYTQTVNFPTPGTLPSSGWIANFANTWAPPVVPGGATCQTTYISMDYYVCFVDLDGNPTGSACPSLRVMDGTPIGHPWARSGI